MANSNSLINGSDNSRYTFMYKCRYCGELFGAAYTGAIMGTRCLVLTTCGDGGKEKPAMFPGDLYLHYADGHTGIADFVGCKIEEKP